MGRKTKRKKTNQSISRAPIVSIKQRDEQLANDLKNMKQKDAVKYSMRLVKLISDDPNYQDLIFNLPLLGHWAKRYKLEKKSHGLKQKIFKQKMAQDSAQFIVPKLVNARYVANARNVIEKQLNSDPTYEDKMALMIAKASLEMHGKVVKDIKIGIAEVPLFQIAFAASNEFAKKLAKNYNSTTDDKQEKKDQIDKNNLNDEITNEDDSFPDIENEKGSQLFPRWEQDMEEYHETLARELRQISNDAKNSLFLPEQATVLLQKEILNNINQGHIDRTELENFAQKKRLSSETQAKIFAIAEKTIQKDIYDFQEILILNIEKSLKDNFHELAYLVFSYLPYWHRKTAEPGVESSSHLINIYAYQAFLQMLTNDNKIKSAQDWQDMTQRAKSKEEQLLCLCAAYKLGDMAGKTVYQMGNLYKSLNIRHGNKKLYQAFLANENAAKDKFFKKISKDFNKLDQ